MEHSANSDSSSCISSWFYWRRFFTLALLFGLGLAVIAPASYAWFQSMNFQFVASGSLSLAPLHSETTAFSLQPLVVAEVVQPTIAPTVNNLRPTSQSPAKPAPTRAIFSSSATSSSTISEQILALVNQQRSQQGLTAMRLNSQLSASAQAYARQMQQQHFFSHTAPDGTTFVQRNEAAGYTGWRWLAENIAYGQSSAQEVMADWMQSPEHKANILDPKAQDLGVGFAAGTTPYWVQEFGAK